MTASVSDAKVWNDVELADLDRRFEHATPHEIVSWAVGAFGRGVCVAASMADAVLIDIAVTVKPDIEILFIDTGYHFPETIETVERVRERYGANIRTMRNPKPTDDLWKTETEGCCAVRKVAMLDQALADYEAWMSGLRRVESPTRGNARISARDIRGKVKINPLANWSDEQVDAYIAERDVPVNPLITQGYASIGCWPCTSLPTDPNDPRSGRWAGSEKTECGLHY